MILLPGCTHITAIVVEVGNHAVSVSHSSALVCELDFEGTPGVGNVNWACLSRFPPWLALKACSYSWFGVQRLQFGSLPALSALSHYLMF